MLILWNLVVFTISYTITNKITPTLNPPPNWLNLVQPSFLSEFGAESGDNEIRVQLCYHFYTRFPCFYHVIDDSKVADDVQAVIWVCG